LTTRRLGRLPAWGWLLGTLTLLTGVITGVLILNQPSTPAPRTRAYHDLDACLLTDGHGITTGHGAQAWQGLQTYSSKSAVRVSYTPTIGADNPTTATQFLNGLIQRRCRVIVTTGTSQNTAVDNASTHAPNTRFLVIGGIPHDRPNVTTLDPATPHLPNQIAELITKLMKGL
jgi:basic membrane lipoprotein Med (substrate-binding protein (PBP1-ABC) superfamily)